MHRSACLSGDGQFDLASGIVLGRRSRLTAEGSGQLVLATDAWIGDDCELSTAQTIRIGARTSLQNRSTILGDVTMGSGCVCAANLYISSAWHHFEDDAPLPIRWQDANTQARQTGPAPSRCVEIGEDCWIGINVVVAPGVRIGRGCVVGANSVVSRHLPAYVIAAGAPARVIRKRLEFSPPRELQANLSEHLPYFYRGFDMWRSHATQLRAALRHGGWPAEADFALAMQVSAGARITLTLHCAVAGSLRHASTAVPVKPGTSRVSFAALVSDEGLLEFEWIADRPTSLGQIAVIAVEQVSD
jgi:acetyltransferase-like isoleucine patch superfamily enzyme